MIGIWKFLGNTEILGFFLAHIENSSTYIENSSIYIEMCRHPRIYATHIDLPHNISPNTCSHLHSYTFTSVCAIDQYTTVLV